ncbi:MAG: uroporphyrinogen-III C-methyltransferase [Lachnospiraceae bacterium]|nr:uroporphyrinogen-III C-methyltransferase [Lachnospiraceae bacterium]
MEKVGKVTLVGAGPSDPGLFTLKGKRALEAAEAVVYDALVGQGILNMIPGTAEAINVGKRANHHTMPQNEISQLLVQKAKEGKRVVRLKGGDPFLFGRGGEEIEALVQEGIPFEVVPGVTSALAVPAYQGIPVTHRDFCSSVHIITGHKRAAAGCSHPQTEKSLNASAECSYPQTEESLNAAAECSHSQTEKSLNASAGCSHSQTGEFLNAAEPAHALPDNETVPDIDFDALVRTKGTLVFLMGVSSLGDICRGLLVAGMQPSTPAALLIQGTTAHQRRIIATVATLEEEVKRQGSDTPAIIVVGDVCALAEEFSWVDRQPLGGVKVLLTRPKELISETAAKLREKGAEVLELPTIRTERIPYNGRLAQAFERLDTYQWIVFTSPTGVRIFFEEMKERGIDCRALGSVQFAVIGNGTKKALAEHGFYADLMPDVYDAAHLGRALRNAIVNMNSEQRIFMEENSQRQSSGKCFLDDGRDLSHILIPRAAAGSPELLAELGEGVCVDDIPTYETRYATSPYVDLRKEFAGGAIDYVMFTSASTVRGFAAAVEETPPPCAQRESRPQGEAQEMDYTNVQAICIGKQTEAAAAGLGMKTYVAANASVDSLIERLCEVNNNIR